MLTFLKGGRERSHQLVNGLLGSWKDSARENGDYPVSPQQSCQSS